jgi:acetyl esterase/lipase
VQRDVELAASDAGILTIDVYSPSIVTGTSALPAVVLVHGYPDSGFEKILGCKFRQMQSVVDWARLIAACGIVAIAYETRDPVVDIRALLTALAKNTSPLGVDGNRLAVWACSGHVALALSLLMSDAPARPRCAALLYGYTLDAEGASEVAQAANTFHFANGCAGRHVRELRRDVPIFVARAGQDQLPGLKTALDRFIADALTCNLSITVMNHATGPHSFDLFDDSPATRDVIGQTLEFFRRHLGVASGPEDVR